MRSVASALATYLDSEASRKLVVADLYTLTLQGGQIWRWTEAAWPLEIDGFTYTPFGVDGTPIIKRDRTRQQGKLEVDTLSLTMECGDGAMLGSITLVQAAVAKVLDGATVKIDVAIQVGAAWYVVDSWFVGRISDVEPSSIGVHVTLKSDLEDLAKPVPRFVYQTQCAHVLFDAGCALLKQNFAVAGTVNSGATTTSIPATLSQATGYFTQGWIEFTSGALEGEIATVKAWTTGGTFMLADALPSAPTAGDTFTAYPGCPKTQTACASTGAGGTPAFSNLVHFRGQPYIPKKAAVIPGASPAPTPDPNWRRDLPFP